eukprot:542117-Hanusia_phi.AAC.1
MEVIWAASPANPAAIRSCRSSRRMRRPGGRRRSSSWTVRCWGCHVENLEAAPGNASVLTFGEWTESREKQGRN